MVWCHTVLTRFALSKKGLGLNNTLILNAIGFGSSTDPWTNVYNITIGNLIISLLGNLPGYFLGAFLVDTIGRRRLQLIGFVGQVIMYTILATAYDKILNQSIALFMVLYAIAQVFNNFGANLTTFIIGKYFARIGHSKFNLTAYIAAEGKKTFRLNVCSGLMLLVV